MAFREWKKSSKIEFIWGDCKYGIWNRAKKAMSSRKAKATLESRKPRKGNVMEVLGRATAEEHPGAVGQLCAHREKRQLWHRGCLRATTDQKNLLFRVFNLFTSPTFSPKPQQNNGLCWSEVAAAGQILHFYSSEVLTFIHHYYAAECNVKKEQTCPARSRAPAGSAPPQRQPRGICLHYPRPWGQSALKALLSSLHIWPIKADCFVYGVEGNT